LAIDAAAAAGELRQLDEDARDPDVELMPADDELYGALVYASNTSWRSRTRTRRYVVRQR
jgi:hypothetical protein